MVVRSQQIVRSAPGGGRMLLEGTAENSTLTQLNLSCNALDFDSAQMLGSIVANTGSLRSLDISCNVFAEDAGRILREGLCGVALNSSLCVGEYCAAPPKEWGGHYSRLPAWP